MHHPSQFRPTPSPHVGQHSVAPKVLVEIDLIVTGSPFPAQVYPLGVHFWPFPPYVALQLVPVDPFIQGGGRAPDDLGDGELAHPFLEVIQDHPLVVVEPHLLGFGARGTAEWFPFGLAGPRLRSSWRR
jgi:hypothetical protein